VLKQWNRARWRKELLTAEQLQSAYELAWVSEQQIEPVAWETDGIDAVCAFIQHLLQRFQLTYRVSFEWSHDCSKPRTDAFGGGAAVISAKEIKTLTTSGWLQEQTRHVFSPQTDRCIYCNISAEDDLLENQPCGH